MVADNQFIVGVHRAAGFDCPLESALSAAPVQRLFRDFRISRPNFDWSARSCSIKAASDPSASANIRSRTACSSSRIGCFVVIVATKKFRRSANQETVESFVAQYLIDSRQFVCVRDVRAVQCQQIFYATHGSDGNMKRVNGGLLRHRVSGNQPNG
jgi:hypothetical protein